MATFVNFVNQNYAKLCSIMPPRFLCEKCDYKTSKKSSFVLHCQSIKHLSTRINQNQPKLCSIMLAEFACKWCEKKYKDKSGLWRHSKKCPAFQKCPIFDVSKNIIQHGDANMVSECGDVVTIDKSIIMSLIKDNLDFKHLLLEQNKTQNVLVETLKESTIANFFGNNGNNGNNISNNNNNNINSNNSFNLNFFLNETCKDAMNIMEFVDSIKPQVNDLIHMEKYGFVNGITNIIAKQLNDIDITKRPIHCTDQKRSTIYIKDENRWEKDDNNNTKTRKAIRKIANKNIPILKEYKTAYPEHKNYVSKRSEQYNKIVIEVMGGSGDNDQEKEDKIVRNISKNVTIDRGSDIMKIK
jgi:hypothetical protein